MTVRHAGVLEVGIWSSDATSDQRSLDLKSGIGGAAIFDLFEPLADRIELTEVLAEIAGDVSMPDLRSSERWSEVASEDHMPTSKTPAWRTVTLVRA